MSVSAWGYDLYDSEPAFYLVEDIAKYFKFSPNSQGEFNARFSGDLLNDKGFILTASEKIVFADNLSDFLKTRFKNNLQEANVPVFPDIKLTSGAQERYALLWVIIGDIVASNRFFVKDFVMKNARQSLNYLSASASRQSYDVDNSVKYDAPKERIKFLNKYKNKFLNHLELIKTYKDIESIKPGKPIKTIKI